MLKTLRILALAAPFLGLLAAEARAQDTVTMRYMAERGELSAHELAVQLGYFKGTGIRFENVGYSQGGPESLFALASGTADIGTAATPAVLNAIASGNPFVAAYPTNGIDKTVHSTFAVLNDSPIHSIQDLAGKTIAVNTLGAHLDYTTRVALASAGLPANAAKLVTVPGPQLEQVLRSHQVDVAAFGYWQTTFAGLAQSHGGIRPVFTDTDVLGTIAGGFTVLRRDFVKAHPQAAQLFVKESARALDYARAHPAETKTILARVLKSRNENPDLAQYFSGYGVRPGGLPTDRDVAFWIDVMTRSGQLQPGQLTPSQVLLVTGDKRQAINQKETAQ
ncbi:ABC transporter substrate-binding protein [Jiella sp. MQZ9-1]|uniref:ABC transporter substrate-binding protein n=1 Tax=Jiella flava TaxID=2816857 RepID=A0A939FX17_9HYPH|nr:ABC transporter substrate-binding protein [Jiella flava]MBO0662439.1 ABC transporter substrate-binding protein [Jiella flava]MCD2471663.1 ABC transporter substrate-binding protein [Jiella flava]